MIIMISLISPLICTSSLGISLCFLILLSPSSFFRHLQPPSFCDRGLSFEEKTRLGSTPSSCHNRCNGCHSCMAVQVPTLPSHDWFQPGLNKAITNPMQFFDPSGNQYSNYKPLGWKCRCGDHFYNP